MRDRVGSLRSPKTSQSDTRLAILERELRSGGICSNICRQRAAVCPPGGHETAGQPKPPVGSNVLKFSRGSGGEAALASAASAGSAGIAIE